MASWVSLHLLLLVCLSASRGQEESAMHARVAEFASATPINNVVQDPETGRIYLGAVNGVHQLGPSLRREALAETGPRMDSRFCTPPLGGLYCRDTWLMDNHNKLLLVHPSNGSLIVCGSRYRGLCSLLNLTDVEQQLYYSDRKGEKTWVASIEDSVNVVGVMSTFKDRYGHGPLLNVFMVGKGYGSRDSTKLISTRILQDYRDWMVFDSVVEASKVQTAPFDPKYLHDFRHAFTEGGFVYFLFSRTLDGSDNKNLTFVSRLCEGDPDYFSHTELQLKCGGNNRYNKVQAAFVGSAGKELARTMTESTAYGTVMHFDKVLFVVASSDKDAGADSALCMYPLNAINERLEDIIIACYSDSGLISGKYAVANPYSSKTDDYFCESRLDKDMVNTYKCGNGNFLSYPLASKPDFALTAEAVVTIKGLLTAVAVAVENDHTIAFLGNSQGIVSKVHLTFGNWNDSPDVYGNITSRDLMGEKVNRNLFFDLSHSHVYITGEKKIMKVPVQKCHLKTDCQSCVALRDPYCGWCVLEGRCTRRSECRRAEERNVWLWSPRQECVKIVSFHPSNLSCKKTGQVQINIASLPSIAPTDSLRCVFSFFNSIGKMTEPGQVSCHLPDPAVLPPTPEDQDFVAVPIKVILNKTVELATREFKFYNCTATVKRAANTPCMSCVSSQWECQWNTLDHTCSDMDDTVTGPNIIKHDQEGNCPRFENPDPMLIPVGFKTLISFEGIHLDVYKGRTFTIGTELMRNTEEAVIVEGGHFYSFRGFNFSYDKLPNTTILFYVKDRETGKKIDSILSVNLYNCSMGREDCSLCKNTDHRYQCVWCARRKACVYGKLCASDQRVGEDPNNIECPDPQITDIIPRFGPMKGGIYITIRGSNLGIQKEDIKSIKVVGEPCKHLTDKYSVSTSVVCEISPLRPQQTQHWGHVEVEVEGGKKGTSSLYFTYRDPIPMTVQPTRGIKAGGMLLTIRGKHLDTGTKDDIRVTIGDVECTVEQFGPNITCRTGEYRVEKVPSDLLTVTVKYGKSTTTSIPNAFRFLENPDVIDHSPKSSFDCGGRTIVVTGSGFDIIQNAFLTVKDLGDNCTSSKQASVEYRQEAHSKNDTVIQFLSPTVNRSYDSQLFRSCIHLDNWVRELRPFHYHPDPVFHDLPKKVITETSIIIVTGRGFSNAMTAKEAQAYVGDVRCVVIILQDEKLFLDPPRTKPNARSKRHRRDTGSEQLDLLIKFGKGEWVVGSVHYESKYEVPLYIIISAVIVPMLLIIAVSVYCYWRKSQQAERKCEKVKHQMENLEESVRDRCKKEFRYSVVFTSGSGVELPVEWPDENCEVPSSIPCSPRASVEVSLSKTLNP